MRKWKIIGTAVIALLFVAAGCGKHADDSHEVRTEMSHAGHEEHAGKTREFHAAQGQEGEAHEEHGEHEAHGEHEGEDGMEVMLSPEAIRMAGITLAKVENGRIGRELDCSGEVGFNEDRLVHITPRFSGIAREVNFRVGEYAREGDVVAVVESNESFTKYPLKTPISGRIIEKHVATGEYVSNEESIFLIADLSTVWVNLAVYPVDAPKVRPGQSVSIAAVGSDRTARGTLQYVTPVMDPQTRRITARILLPNGKSEWRPGMFVNAHVDVGESAEGLVVEKAAVQVLGEKSVVFVQHEPGGFRPVEVTTGESDKRLVRILSGLEQGAEYVNGGAFELKAKIVTGALGGHAGHGH